MPVKGSLLAAMLLLMASTTPAAAASLRGTPFPYMALQPRGMPGLAQPRVQGPSLPPPRAQTLRERFNGMAWRGTLRPLFNNR